MIASPDAARADDTITTRFTIGAATNVLKSVGVPEGREGTGVIQGGVIWRYRFVDWFSVGGGIFAGADFSSGADYSIRSVRAEIISTQFDIPVSQYVRPYMRLGMGVTSQTVQDRRFMQGSSDPNYPYHSDGFFGLAAPGVLIHPLRWLSIYAEFQSNVSASGAPGSGDMAVQLGGEFGLGFAF